VRYNNNRLSTTGKVILTKKKKKEKESSESNDTVDQMDLADNYIIFYSADSQSHSSQQPIKHYPK
jgi:hypothetical protein